MSLLKKDKFLTFARLVFEGSTAVDAAVKIGAPPKWKNQYAIKWMKRPEVRALLDDLRKQADTETVDVKKRIVDRLTKSSFFDIRNVITWDENQNLKIKASEKLTDEEAAMIDQITIDKYGKMKIKFLDKTRCIELLGKHLGMFETNAVGSKENPLCVNTVSALSDQDLLAVVQNGAKS
jgi:hypothetical protein